MFLERGSSPAEVLAVYRACLRELALEQAQPPFDPVICLLRVMAGLVDQYQLHLSMAQLQKAA
jgi:hypothetical protein